VALDPVCGMTVDPARAAGQFEHDGTTYYFCSKGCLAKFAADPQKYLSGTREPMSHAPAVISLGSLKKSTQHSAPSTQHSALSTHHPAAPITHHSALSIQHSALSTQHSALITHHSSIHHPALSTQHSKAHAH
jgi:YHS domain-containing protein